MKKEVFNIEVVTSIQVTQQDIDDIMVAALEGGITYWADAAVVPGDRRVADWGHEQIARGGVLRIHTTEPWDKDDTEWYELTREKLLDGIKKAYEGSYYTDYDWCDGQTLDCCQVDAEVADAIVQLALFGEVVYG